MDMLNLSCREHMPAGRLIETMHSEGFLQDILRPEEYLCRIGEGLENQLQLQRMSTADIDVFLGLIPEFCARYDGQVWPERKRHFLSRAELLLMGADAPILDVLDDFREGPNHAWATREMRAVQEGLESEGKPFKTLGDMSQYTSSEISGPQCRYAGNRSKIWMGWAMERFGLPHKLTGH